MEARRHTVRIFLFRWNFILGALAFGMISGLPVLGADMCVGLLKMVAWRFWLQGFGCCP